MGIVFVFSPPTAGNIVFVPLASNIVYRILLAVDGIVLLLLPPVGNIVILVFP